LDEQKEPPKNAKSVLHEWAMARGLGLPDYAITTRTGPPHSPAFVVTVAVGGFSGSGTAGTKRAAEQLAAQDLLQVLGA
jgi:ribonuclease-3